VKGESNKKKSAMGEGGKGLKKKKKKKETRDAG